MEDEKEIFGDYDEEENYDTDYSETLERPETPDFYSLSDNVLDSLLRAKGAKKIPTSREDKISLLEKLYRGKDYNGMSDEILIETLKKRTGTDEIPKDRDEIIDKLLDLDIKKRLETAKNKNKRIKVVRKNEQSIKHVYIEENIDQFNIPSLYKEWAVKWGLSFTRGYYQPVKEVKSVIVYQEEPEITREPSAQVFQHTKILDKFLDESGQVIPNVREALKQDYVEALGKIKSAEYGPKNPEKVADRKRINVGDYVSFIYSTTEKNYRVFGIVYSLIDKSKDDKPLELIEEEVLVKKNKEGKFVRTGGKYSIDGKFRETCLIESLRFVHIPSEKHLKLIEKRNETGKIPELLPLSENIYRVYLADSTLKSYNKTAFMQKNYKTTIPSLDLLLNGPVTEELKNFMINEYVNILNSLFPEQNKITSINDKRIIENSAAALPSQEEFVLRKYKKFFANKYHDEINNEILQNEAEMRKRAEIELEKKQDPKKILESFIPVKLERGMNTRSLLISMGKIEINDEDKDILRKSAKSRAKSIQEEEKKNRESKGEKEDKEKEEEIEVSPLLIEDIMNRLIEKEIDLKLKNVTFEFPRQNYMFSRLLADLSENKILSGVDLAYRIGDIIFENPEIRFSSTEIEYNKNKEDEYERLLYDKWKNFLKSETFTHEIEQFVSEYNLEARYKDLIDAKLNKDIENASSQLALVDFKNATFKELRKFEQLYNEKQLNVIRDIDEIVKKEQDLKNETKKLKAITLWKEDESNTKLLKKIKSDRIDLINARKKLEKNLSTLNGEISQIQYSILDMNVDEGNLQKKREISLLQERSNNLSKLLNEHRDKRDRIVRYVKEKKMEAVLQEVEKLSKIKSPFLNDLVELSDKPREIDVLERLNILIAEMENIKIVENLREEERVLDILRENFSQDYIAIFLDLNGERMNEIYKVVQTVDHPIVNRLRIKEQIKDLEKQELDLAKKLVVNLVSLRRQTISLSKEIYGVREEIEKKSGELKKREENITRKQIEDFEEKIHLTHGKNRGEYLFNMCIPMVFLTRLKNYASFFMSKIKHQVFRFSDLADMKFVEYLPEIFMNRPLVLENPQELNKIQRLLFQVVFDQAHTMAYRFNDIIHPSSKVSPPIPRIGIETELNRLIVVPQNICRNESKTGYNPGTGVKIQDDDLLICYSNDTFTCHSIYSIISNFAQQNYINPYTNQEYSKEFIDKMTVRYSKEIEKIRGKL